MTLTGVALKHNIYHFISLQLLKNDTRAILEKVQVYRLVYKFKLSSNAFMAESLASLFVGVLNSKPFKITDNNVERINCVTAVE